MFSVGCLIAVDSQEEHPTLKQALHTIQKYIIMYQGSFLTNPDKHMPSLADASDCDTSTSYSTCSHDRESSDMDMNPYWHPKSPRRIDCFDKVPTHSQNKIDKDSLLIRTSKHLDKDRKKERSKLLCHKNDPAQHTISYTLCSSLFCDLLPWGEEIEDEICQEATEDAFHSTQASSHPLNSTKQYENIKPLDDSACVMISHEGTVEKGVEAWITDATEIFDACYCVPNDIEETLSMVQGNTIKMERRKSNEPLTQKFKNRSVFARDKAMERIYILRKSGLSKDFSLGQLSSREMDTRYASTKQDRLMRNKGLRYHNDHTARIMNSKSVDWSSLVNSKKKEGKLRRQPANSPALLRSSFEPNDIFVTCSAKQSIGLMPSAASASESQIDLYYDSDPGPEIDHEGAGKVHCINNGENSGLGWDDERGRNSVYKHALPETYVSLLEMDDKYDSSQVVSELINGDYIFIWHPNIAQGQNGLREASHPLLVKCWFEMGTCLKTLLLHPKFFWKSISPMQGHDNKCKHDIFTTPQHIELLNIVRILTPVDITREAYPFVKTQNSFIILTSDNHQHLFETKNHKERDRFLFAFKLMIARLASKIIVGDSDVFDEFFSSSGANIERYGEAEVSGGELDYHNEDDSLESQNS